MANRPTPAYDYWEHIQGVTDYPTGNGTRGTGGTPILTGITKRVILRAIIPMLNATAASGLNILKGDGSTAYFTQPWPMPGNFNGAGTSIDMLLPEGLAISGGTAGAWLIVFHAV